MFLILNSACHVFAMLLVCVGHASPQTCLMLQMEAGTMQCFGGAERASLTCVDSLPCQKNISCERCVPPSCRVFSTTYESPVAAIRGFRTPACNGGRRGALYTFH